MKLRWIALPGVFLLATQVYAQGEMVLKDQRDKVSYSIGMEIGTNLKSQPMDLNPDAIAKGMKDAFSGGKALMTEQEIRETMTAFQKEVMVKREEQRKILGEKNRKEGEAFLGENKKKEGVITLPSGLQYKVIKPGEGKKPQRSANVTTHYKGMLIDGTEFDSSYRRGQPASFPVSGVIPGWTEALQLMEAGAKWQLFVPSNLAYGERGAGNVIGPNATLIFEIELISVD